MLTAQIGMPSPLRRFRYRPVPKQDYGLDIVDLLQLDAKELNQVGTAAQSFTLPLLSACTLPCQAPQPLHRMFVALRHPAVVASQVVGLKRLAPYREERGRQYANTQKLQELRKGQEPQPRRRKPPKQAAAQNGSAAAPEADGKANTKAKPQGGDGAAVVADPTAQQPAADESEKVKRIAKQPRAGGLTAKAELPAGDADAEEAAAERKAARKAEREQEQRLQSYGKLTLRPEGGSKGTKRKAEAAAEAQAVAADGLTRGERKRLKRSQKRAAKRASDGTALAADA
jgi:KRI1-like family C-terminal